MGDEYDSADDEKMQMETNDDKPRWKLYYGEHFCNVNSKVVIRSTMRTMILLEWIGSQLDYKIYIHDMWKEDGNLIFQAKAALSTHVEGWMNQLVTRARVLLTETSYNVVVTDDLQDRVNKESHDMMLLHNYVGQQDELRNVKNQNEDADEEDLEVKGN